MRRRLDQVRAVVVGRDVHPGRKQVVPPDLRDLGAHALERAPRVAADLHQHDSLDDVVVAVVADDAEPGRVADRHVRDVADAQRRSALEPRRRRLPMSSRPRIRPMPRTLKDCSPTFRTLAPTFWFDAASAASSGESARPWPRSRYGSTSTWYCWTRPPKPGDVDDAVDLLELALQDPVLGGLALERRVPGARDDVAVDLADRVLGREHGLEVVRKLNLGQSVQDLLPVLAVVGAPLEVALDVGEAEDRDRAEVIEARHAVQRHLERHRRVPLDLLGGPARGLHDRLDARRHGVRVRLDVQVPVRPEPRADERDPRGENGERVVQRERDDPPDHANRSRPTAGSSRRRRPSRRRSTLRRLRSSRRRRRRARPAAAGTGSGRRASFRPGRRRSAGRPP